MDKIPKNNQSKNHAPALGRRSKGISRKNPSACLLKRLARDIERFNRSRNAPPLHG